MSSPVELNESQPLPNEEKCKESAIDIISKEEEAIDSCENLIQEKININRSINESEECSSKNILQENEIIHSESNGNNLNTENLKSKDEEELKISQTQNANDVLCATEMKNVNDLDSLKKEDKFDVTNSNEQQETQNLQEKLEEGTGAKITAREEIVSAQKEKLTENSDIEAGNIKLAHIKCESEKRVSFKSDYYETSTASESDISAKEFPKLIDNQNTTNSTTILKGNNDQYIVKDNRLKIEDLNEETDKKVQVNPNFNVYNKENTNAKIKPFRLNGDTSNPITESSLVASKEEIDQSNLTSSESSNYDPAPSLVCENDNEPKEIQNKNLKSQLKQIINEIDKEVKHDEKQKEEESSETNSNVKIEIPEGIPLLRKILPEDGEAEHQKIPLERLFTPAEDVNDIATLKKRKLFSSSSFYRPDHPTIEDQVKLAHEISVSLVDEINKQSKGHRMYMKRRSKSSSWIHAGNWSNTEISPPKESKGPPPLKLLLNPKGVHDYQSIKNENYENECSTYNNKKQKSGITEVNYGSYSNPQTPTGKGAALFAKRKARMDKYIVDETTVQNTSKKYNKPGRVEAIVQNNTLSSQLRSDEADRLISGNIYKAEIKVEEKPLIFTPDAFESSSVNNSFLNRQESTREKRKSKCFNLAPKGWGTYTDYYTPIHLSSS